MTSKKPLFLILDGNALLHRAWHSIPPLTTRDGRVVNAVYGFTMILEKLLETQKPTYMAVAWDLPGKTFRHEAYKAYKATREKKAQELYDQIPMIQELLTHYGIPSISAPGYEADDVIGTLTKKASTKGVKSVIVTGDLDSLQLVDDDVTNVLFFVKGISETKTYDEAAVKERYGLTPAELIDYKALRGDASDNLPGVPGIGEKGGTELIQTYHSIDGIFKALKKGEVPEKLAKKLEGHEKTAREMRTLVEIVRDIPLTFTLAKWTPKPDVDALRETFRDLEFKTLLKKYAGAGESEEPKENKGPKGTRAAIVRDAEHLREQLSPMREAMEIAVFVGEPRTDLFGTKTPFVAVSNGTTTVVVPEPSAEHFEEIAGALRGAALVVTHDLKAMLHRLADAQTTSFESVTAWYDIMIASYLLEAGTREHDLAGLLHSYLKKEFTIPEGSSLTDADLQKAGATATALLELLHLTKAELEHNHLWKLFHEMEMPLLPVLFRMERAGIKLDTAFLKTLSKDFEKTLATLTKNIHKAAGVDFNINSPSQLAEVLFETLKLPTQGIKKTKTGFSTAAPELEKLEDAHAIIPMIGEYRELAKLKSTYVDSLPTLVKSDGRLHTTFYQAVASTGRLSSADPNLQNIPIKTEIGNRIRKAFVAEKGKKLVAADYSQIELRLAAVIAKDKPFIDTFKDNADVHTRTASEVWGVAESEVTSEQRRAAKAINFGILYGMGPRSLSRSTGLSMTEAKAFIERYFEIHHAIKDYMDATKALAHTQGYVETLFGRRRHFPEINTGVPMLIASAERMAINMPVQGTEADVLKMAMIQVEGWIRTLEKGEKRKGVEKVRMLLQVHDELVFEVDGAFVNEAAKAIQHLMETTVNLEVPLTVNVEVGDNWGEMEEWKG